MDSAKGPRVSSIILIVLKWTPALNSSPAGLMVHESAEEEDLDTFPQRSSHKQGHHLGIAWSLSYKRRMSPM